jgi:steroid delta-isomerase-like uncharacterized protein
MGTGLDGNKALVRSYYEVVLEGRDAAALDRLLGPGFRSHGADGTTVGPDGYRRAVLASHAAFPDLRVEVLDQVAEGDLVATRWRAEGTQAGPFGGLPASGRRVEIGAMHLHRVSGGRLAEHWEQLDTLGLLRQLGALPG